MRKLVLSILLLLNLVVSVYAQKGSLSTDNKKAIELYQKAIESYERYDYPNTLSLLNQSIDKDPKFIEALLMISQVYQEMRSDDKAILFAEKAIAVNPDFFPNIYFNLGNMWLNKGEYDKALNKYNKFLEYKAIKPQTKKVAERRKLSCDFALNAIQNPVPFNPINLGANINTSLDEYWPTLSADENTLVITTNVPRDSSVEAVMYNRQEDFYISHRNSEGIWEPKMPVGKPLNTPFNEGAQTIGADGKRMYYTVCRNVCNIFSSDLMSNGTWSRPVRLSETINSNKFSNKQPSISPDGRTLYFVSNRPGGYGGYDIWKSIIKDDGNWTEPENLGNLINTDEDEQSPFIHFDNQTLYFSSFGHVGMGGEDIFISKLNPDGTWSEPKNLGYPINTFRNEEGLIVNARGTTAYYNSDRIPQNGRDIYTFELYPEIRPIPSSYVIGTIADAKSRMPLKATFSLVDLENMHEVMKPTSSEDGSYLVCIPSKKSYALYASVPSYLFFSDHFDLKEVHSIDKPFRKDINLNPIKVNEVMVMRNIFFATDSFKLKTESTVELSRLVSFLKENQTLRIEIGGHTDDQGDNAYNQKLSEHRAKSVVDFLVSRMIAADRVKWVGYGELKPIADNKTEEGRALNRRTEVKIIGM